MIARKRRIFWYITRKKCWFSTKKFSKSPFRTNSDSFFLRTMTSFLIMNSLGPFEISRHIHLSNVHIRRIEMFECSIHGKRWFQDVCSALEWCVGFFIWIDLGPCSESDSLPYSSLAESDLIDWEPKNSKNHNN